MEANNPSPRNFRHRHHSHVEGSSTVNNNTTIELQGHHHHDDYSSMNNSPRRCGDASAVATLAMPLLSDSESSSHSNNCNHLNHSKRSYTSPSLLKIMNHLNNKHSNMHTSSSSAAVFTRLYGSLVASLVIVIILYNQTVYSSSNSTASSKEAATAAATSKHHTFDEDSSTFFLFLLKALLTITLVLNVSYTLVFTRTMLPQSMRQSCLSAGDGRSHYYNHRTTELDPLTPTIMHRQRGGATPDDRFMDDSFRRMESLSPRSCHHNNNNKTTTQSLHGTQKSSTMSLTTGRLLVILASGLCGTNFAAVKMLDQAMPMSLSASLRFSLAAASAIIASMVTTIINNNNNSGSNMESESTSSSLSNKKKQAVNNGATDGDSDIIIELRKKEAARQRQERSEATLVGGEVGLWYCIGYIAQASGLHTSGASKSAFFNALAVIVVPLLDKFIKGRELGVRGMLSVLTAIAGVAILQLGPSYFDGTAAAAEGFEVSTGDTLCLAQAVFFGIGYWRLEAASTRYPDQGGGIVTGQLSAVALGAIAFLLGTEKSLPSYQALQHWLTDPFIVKTIIWTGLCSTALALYLETVALRVVSASELTVLMTSVSIFGSAFAYATMGETLDSTGFAGGLLILSGCVISATGGGSHSNEHNGAVMLDVNSEQHRN